MPTSPPSDAEQFRLLVEQVKDYAIFLLTPEGCVATWNAGAEAIKGYRADEIIGSHFSRFYEGEAVARGWPQHELAMARSTGRFEDEGWRVRKDGTRFWASVVITALHDAGGALTGFAKVTRDLTARRRIEELQRSETRMNEFLAILGHELRNPLAPMRTALEIAARAGSDVEAQRYSLGLFERQLAHLTRLVDDLLDLGRISNGRIAYRFAPVELGELARSAVDAMQPLCAAGEIAVSLRLPGLPTPMIGDATRLVQAINNLLSNAIKFTPRGGRITVTLEHDADFALLQVADDGSGIEDRLLPLVFDPFTQGERELDRPGGGLGIGLALVKRLVEAHGGTVAAASAGVGRGSTFSLRMPMRPHAPVAAQAAAEAAAGPRRLRLLIVDDNRDIAESTAMLLRMLGHEVDVALDGERALACARANTPDLVLLDIGLPRMSGYEVARALRALPATRGATLVACTGYGRDEDRELARAAGFDRHAVKPVEPRLLLDILAQASARTPSAPPLKTAAGD